MKKRAPKTTKKAPPQPQPLEKRPVGRPTKLDQVIGPSGETVAQLIERAVRAGSYIEEAAESVGVSRSVVYQWLEQGRARKSSLHVEFLDAIERARAHDAVRDLALITQAASQPLGALDWRAAAWKRERKDPQRWGQKIRVTVVEELNAFLDELERVLPGEWYEKALEVAARLGGEEAVTASSEATAGAGESAGAAAAGLVGEDVAAVRAAVPPGSAS